MSLTSPALAGGFLATSAAWEARNDSQNSEKCLLTLMVYCKGGEIRNSQMENMHKTKYVESEGYERLPCPLPAH